MADEGGEPAIVFVGPTIDPEIVAGLAPGVTVVPPVERGDVRAAVLAGYRVLGLIDGYFEHVPSVWHKEILMALDEGCSVVGASSLGALRAAELEPFGMEGVGRVFELVAEGVLSDADVAVAHGPAPAFERFSEPHANVHVTVEAASAAGVLDSHQADLVIEVSRSLFYPQRVYPELIRRAEERGLPTAAARRLETWLEHGAIDAKAEDAVILVERCRELRTGGASRDPVGFSMSITAQFLDMCHEEDLRRATGAIDRYSHSVVEEALLDPELGPDLWDRARSRHLAHGYATLAGIRPTQQLVDEASDDLRRTLNLVDATALEQWLEVNDLDLDGYAEMVRRHCLSLWSQNRIGRRAGQDSLLDDLRISGRYADLARRAADKAELLGRIGHDGVSPVVEVDDEADLDWFFTTVRGRERPADVDHFARTHGLESRAALLRMIRRERVFRSVPNGCDR